MEDLDRNGLASLIFVVIFIATAIFSFKRGRAEEVLKEILDNLFLCFLLISGFAQILFVPVNNDDEIAAGIFFMAFGICRFAIKKQSITSELHQNRNKA